MLPIWSEVGAGLQGIRGLSVASPIGHGVRVAHWLREQVERACRTTERCRFELQEFCHARESALAPAHLRRLGDCGWSVEDSATTPAISGQWTQVLRRSPPRRSLRRSGVGRTRVLGSTLLTLCDGRAAVRAMRTISVSRHYSHYSFWFAVSTLTPMLAGYNRPSAGPLRAQQISCRITSGDKFR